MPKSKNVPDRFDDREDPSEMIFINPGDPVPEIMIQLSNGTLVPKSVFGRPPADMPFDEREVWYADREFQLMSGGDPNWPVEKTGDEE